MFEVYFKRSQMFLILEEVSRNPQQTSQGRDSGVRNSHCPFFKTSQFFPALLLVA